MGEGEEDDMIEIDEDQLHHLLMQHQQQNQMAIQGEDDEDEDENED